MQLDDSCVEEPNEDPHVRFWQSVIVQALIDASRDPSQREEENIATAQAQAWFESSIGVTANDFEDVCLRAGFSTRIIRRIYHTVREQNLKLPMKDITNIWKIHLTKTSSTKASSLS